MTHAPAARMVIDAATKVTGVIGWPIEHTASPAMHNAAFAALGLNWVYLAFAVEPDRLRSALAGVRDLGMAGVNLTVPHKVMAVEMMDEVDAEARQLGAVNTVMVRQGRLCGYCTDGYGFLRAIEEEFNFDLAGATVLVLGAGGAGRAIAVQCALAGASTVYIANRTVSKIEPIAQVIGRTATRCVPLELTAAAIAPVLPAVQLIVNATSVGLRSSDTLDLPWDGLTSQHMVYDTIYRPAETTLLRQAAARGAKTANGMAMLLHQGARAFEIWTGQKAPLAVMRRALRAAIYGEAA